MTLRRRSGVLGLAWLSLGLGPWTAAAADTVAFTIADSRITESSGLARDTGANLYWTVNDSGDEGMAYGMTPDGKVKGTLEFRVAPVDVEAVVMSAQRLYIGDIGDNNRDRREVTVFYFDNPAADDSTVTYRSWDLRYGDGKHDAETLLVSSDGEMFVVTKGSTGAVYAAPSKPRTVGVNELTKVGSAPAMVTDGVFLPGDARIALLTYSEVQVLDAKTYAKIASAEIPPQQQAESLSLSLDGTSLLVGSEGASSKVYEMAIPGEPPSTPGAGLDPANPDGNADSDPSADSRGRRGTFLALGLAAFAALLAGLVVAVVRKP